MGQKSIYHSHLVGYTREHSDGLVCMIEAGPMKSKFGDGEVAKIRVHGEPEGDDNGYWLKIENDDVADALSAIEAKQWVSLRAEGSREAATIVVDTVDGRRYRGARLCINRYGHRGCVHPRRATARRAGNN